jgi:NUMOD3 motif
VGMTTKTLTARLKGHLRNAGEKNHRAYWIRSLLAAGVKPEIAEVEVVPVSDRAAAEQCWIAFYRAQGARLVNATDGGEGATGFKMSPEARRKMSEAKKGKPQPHLLAYRLGVPHSEETKERIREATIRQFRDPAQREAVSRVHKGKVISEEHRQIVGAAAKRRWEEWRASGKTVSDETRAKIVTAAKARVSRSHSAESRAKMSQMKRQWWAERKAAGKTGPATSLPRRRAYKR